MFEVKRKGHNPTRPQQVLFYRQCCLNRSLPTRTVSDSTTRILSSDWPHSVKHDANPVFVESDGKCASCCDICGDSSPMCLLTHAPCAHYCPRLQACPELAPLTDECKQATPTWSIDDKHGSSHICCCTASTSAATLAASLVLRCHVYARGHWHITLQKRYSSTTVTPDQWHHW